MSRLSHSAALALLLLALAACGGNQGQAEPTAVTAPGASAAPVEQAPNPAYPAPSAAPDAQTPAQGAYPAPSAAAPTEAATPYPPPAIISEAPRKIALVIGLGKVNDGTFNQFAHEGMQRAAAELGLEYTYVETGNLADLDRTIQATIDDGFPLIVTVGVFLQDATRAAARANPEVVFVGVDQTHAGENAAPNLVGLQFREDQAGFLAGAMAALMSESGTVGIVAGPDVAAIKRFKNGFDSGARHVRPEIGLLGVYLESFVDPATGGSTALQLIGEGADVIFGAGGASGSGAIKAAAEAGAYVIGVDKDEYFTTFGGGAAPAADRLLTSAIKRVDVAVFDQVLRFYGERLLGGDVVYDAAKGAIGFAPFHDALVPPEAEARLDEILAQLAAGTLDTGVDPISGDPAP